VHDRFYNVAVFIGRFPLWVSSRPLVLHRDRVPRRGPFLLASNHLSPFDVPALMRHTGRPLDFVSIVEVFRKPFLGWFYGHMNAFPLDRSRSDPKTVKIILARLARGRPVAIFPEGRIRRAEESVVHGGPFRPGVARLARMAGVPLIPVVVWNTGVYQRPTSWLPLKRIRYAVIYGTPIPVTDEADAERALASAYRDLYAELSRALQPASAAHPVGP
jgi:1-acyl-sn-glycerol-3-phosphate acyltransferase